MVEANNQLLHLRRAQVLRGISAELQLITTKDIADETDLIQTVRRLGSSCIVTGEDGFCHTTRVCQESIDGRGGVHHGELERCRSGVIDHLLHKLRHCDLADVIASNILSDGEVQSCVAVGLGQIDNSRGGHLSNGDRAVEETHAMGGELGLSRLQSFVLRFAEVETVG